MELIDQIISEVDAALTAARSEQGAVGLAKAEIQILGQMSLLMDPVASEKLPLVATFDVDALLKGGWRANNIFKEALSKRGLVLDDLSSEVWLPPCSKFVEYYDSSTLSVSYLDPLSALISKAVKAKEKNRLLIAAGLKVYGAELREKIEDYGGDIDYFASAEGLKL